MIFVPGYREVTEAMVQRLKEVRSEPPMRSLSDARFGELVGCAERYLAEARRLEPEAATGEPRALELYKARCDEARRAVYCAHDEPAARAGLKSILGGRKGGTRKPKPAWHEAARAHAMKLQTSGTSARDLTAKCAAKVQRSDDVVRRFLQDEGLIPRRKSRV